MRPKFHPLSPALAALLVLVGVPGPTAARAENWPQFRGPRADGTSLESGAPVEWDSTRNVRWRAPLPGEGHSSPVVWEDAVFLTTAIQETGERRLLRLDAKTGAILWQATAVKASPDAMHRENNSASSTPATDGVRVFTSFQSGNRVDLRCFDFQGNLVWSAQPLEFNGEHGYSYSPILHGDLVLFDCRQEGEAAFLALEKETGKVRWRSAPAKRRISHVTPLVIEHDGKAQVIAAGSDEIRSHDPATGELLWRLRGLSDVAVAGLAYGDGMVFATAGYPVRTRMAARVDGRGEVSDSHIAWSHRRQVSYVPSPVFHKGRLYTVVDEGMLFCFDAATGEALWDHRLGGRFRSSLVLAGGRVYATNDRGLTTVFEASPEAFRPLATNDLAGLCYATPAISQGNLYLRAGEHLYCIGAEQ